MPSGSYLDTSFLWKLYVNEARSEEAVLWMASASRPRLVFVSELSDVEIASSLHRRFPLPQAMGSLANYRADIEAGIFERVTVDPKAMVLAASLAERFAGAYGLRSLDAIQIAVALHHGIPEIATFDARLARAAQAAGLKLSF